MNDYFKINSYAKVNLALNIVGKIDLLHKIESIISFLNLSDEILIKKTQDNHKIKFTGKFSKDIPKNNTISKLFKILDKKKLLNNRKYRIIIKKNIPSQAGLGGGSMNAASILKFMIKRKILKINQKEILEISNLVGSDVILGIHERDLILKSNGEIKDFFNVKKKHVLVIKPDFGCSTKKIYSQVRKFSSVKFNKPKKSLFSYSELNQMNNDLEQIVFKISPKLKKLKNFLENLSNIKLVRMTGSGSAIVAYFSSKKLCIQAEKKVKKCFRKYWCIIANTI